MPILVSFINELDRCIQKFAVHCLHSLRMQPSLGTPFPTNFPAITPARGCILNTLRMEQKCCLLPFGESARRLSKDARLLR